MDKVIKEGKLTKRGTGYPYTWRERQFCLTPRGLAYATIDGAGKGNFPITKSTVVTSLVQADLPGRKSPFGFKLTTGLEDLYMFAFSEEERTQWVEAIMSALNTAPTTVSPVVTVKKAAPVANESRLEELERRIEVQKKTVASNRAKRVLEMNKVEESNRKAELSRIVEENSETVGLARLLAECKINEDASKLSELKKSEKKLNEIKDSTDSEMQQVYNEESVVYNESRSKLATKAIQLTKAHADAEAKYNQLKDKADLAEEEAEAAEAHAKELRAKANDLSAAESDAKMEYEVFAMLASAPWTNEFKEQIDSSRRKVGGKAPVANTKREAYSSTHSKSFARLIDLEKRRKVDKKLGSEHNFFDRFIWLDEDSGCIHWGKKEKPGSGSKSIHIKSCIKAVLLCRPPKGATWMGFSLQLYPDLPKTNFVNARGMSSKDECIDIKVSGDDAAQYVEAVCKRVIEIIKS